MSRLFCVITLFIFSYTFSASSSRIQTARPLPLTESQFHLLLQERSSNNPFTSDQRLWFTTPGKIWSWSFDLKQLRYQNISKNKIPITAILPYSEGFIATNDEQILFIQRKPFGVFTINRPNTTLALHRINHQIWWVRTDGASLIHPSQHMMSHKHKFQGLLKNDKTALTLSPLTLWVARENNLFSMTKNKEQVRYRHIKKTKNKILNLNFDEKDIYATTQNNILRFHPNGTFIQSIPMRGTQSILQSHITKNNHTYLLSSRIVEIYSPHNKTIKRHRLPIQNAKTVSHLQLHKNYLSLLLDGHPKVFQIQTTMMSTNKHQNKTSL
ncbi:MAG: hypothetical protein AB8C84_10670 [Oligoflexales bacterium]